MTLNQLFDYLGQSPLLMLLLLGILPLAALINGLLAGQKAPYSPWAYIFMFIIYAASITGICSVCLLVYSIVFRKADLMQMNLAILAPIVSLMLTTFITKRFIAFNLIPGLEKLSAVWAMMFASFGILWLMDKVRIYVFSMMPFQYVLGVFLVLFSIIYFSWKKLN